MLGKIEPLLQGFTETSFSNEDEKALGYRNIIKKADVFFKMAKLIQEKSEMISHYRADIVEYTQRKWKKNNIVDNSSKAVVCAQKLIDYTVLHSGLLLDEDPEKKGRLTCTINFFYRAEQLYATVEEEVFKQQKRRDKNTMASIDALLEEANQCYRAAQKQEEVNPWIRREIFSAVNNEASKINQLIGRYSFTEASRSKSRATVEEPQTSLDPEEMRIEQQNTKFQQEER